MRSHLQSPSGQPKRESFAADILFAREVMIRAAGTLETAFHDSDADLRDPARKQHFRTVFGELQTAIKLLAPALA